MKKPAVRMSSVLCSPVVAGVFALGSSGADAAIRSVPAQYPSIQAAIDASSSGDEVVVAPGSYPGGIAFTGKAITVRSENPTDPEVVAATVIYGVGEVGVISFVDGEGPNAKLAGFTVTDASSGGYGGVHASGASPTIQHCRFISNGGAAISTEGGSPNVDSCEFEENDRAMYVYYASPTVTNSSFRWSYDGAILVVSGEITASDCTFRDNYAGLGAAAWTENGSTSTFIGCSFHNNHASGSGGALMNDGDVTIIDCSFTENSSGAGGAMSNDWTSDVTIEGSTFCGNLPDHIAGTWHDSGGNVFDVSCGVPGDLNGDGVVNSADLAMLLGQWGFDGSADLTADGTVDAADLSMLLGYWT